MAAKQGDEKLQHFEIRREDNACTQIWKWDRKKNPNGPVSVETIWKQWILDEWQNKENMINQK